MANYTLSHTGAQVDDAVAAVIAPVENITLSVNSNRLTNFTYTAKYYPILGMAYVRITGLTNTEFATGYDFNIINISGSRVPDTYTPMAVKCNKNCNIVAEHSGIISLRPHETIPSGLAIYIAGWWRV